MKNINDNLTINIKALLTILSICSIIVGFIFFIVQVKAITDQNTENIKALEVTHKEQLQAAQTRINYLEEKYAEINAQLKVIQAQNEDIKRRLEKLEERVN